MFIKTILAKSVTPAPTFKLLDLSSDERAKACAQLGVANVNAVQLGELTEPWRQVPAGALIAMFHNSEGHTMHLRDADVPQASSLRTQPIQLDAGPVATLVPGQEGTIDADAQLDAQDGSAEPSQLDEEVAMWKAEAEGLTSQLVAVKADLDARRELHDADRKARAFAESELTALKVTTHLQAERLRLAEKDRDALKGRLDVERADFQRELSATQAKLDAALSKLDRLDKLDLGKTAREEIERAGIDLTGPLDAVAPNDV